MVLLGRCVVRLREAATYISLYIYIFVNVYIYIYTHMSVYLLIKQIPRQVYPTAWQTRHVLGL